MDQAASEDKKVLGCIRKRSSYSDIFRNYVYWMMTIVQKKINIERSIYGTNSKYLTYKYNSI